jgi:2-oxoglutarate ferredoxin oxidoreductase subunit beta
MVYIVENNGVYGLTKGQFSATAEQDLELKYAGRNPFPPEDLCMEAIISGCGFVARSFSGDPKQVRELLKAALSHRGTAYLDIISPCVTFNNRDNSHMSYSWGKANEEPLHDVNWVPSFDEIVIEDYDPGQVQNVELHDGSFVQLRKLEEDFDPTDRMAALQRLEMARVNGEYITGLIYIDEIRPSLAEMNNLGKTPLAYLANDKLRPSVEALQAVMDKFL